MPLALIPVFSGSITSLERDSLGFPSSSNKCGNRYLLSAYHIQALCFHVLGLLILRRINSWVGLNAHFTGEETRA